MCGIFGYVGLQPDAPQLVLAGLKQLEYRGYDSWGITARRNGAARAELLVEKHVGKIGQAETSLPGSTLALGHTRWATHGSVTQANAHPHTDCGDRLAVVHNGIIENHDRIRRTLLERGHRFRSQTDTEVAAHLMEEEVGDRSGSPDKLATALMRVFQRLEGLSALGILDAGSSAIAVAKNGSPLVLGWGEDGNYVASDSSALVEHTRRLTFLEDGQAALVTADRIEVFDAQSGERLSEARVWQIDWDEERADLEGHPHFMSKEIAEQPRVIRAIADRLGEQAQELARLVGAARDVYLVGCGSAAHAAMAGEYLFSRVAGRRLTAVVGSEFTYREHFLDEGSLAVALSQSGETIDLLDSAKAAKRRGAKLAALVNVEGSSLFRMVDYPVLLGAGPERCVLATKSFTAKLGVLTLAAYALRGRLEEGQEVLERAAAEIQAFLTDGRTQLVRQLAERFQTVEHLYVIGRSTSYPLALEAALKIKEVSYIHAEGFAGGELKHGVIALVEEGTPCLVLAPDDETFSAVVSGAQEIKARGGYIVGISPNDSEAWDAHIPVANVGEGAAMVNAIPPQVLAYNLALLRGLDPDKPRNLAKSVTVK